MDIQEARFISHFVKVEEGKGSVVWKCLVPGHEGRQYLVLLRKEGKQLIAECLQATQIGDIPCPANRNGLICYHVLATMIAIQDRFGKTISFTPDREAGRKLKNLGGVLFPFVAKYGNQPAWAVVR